MKGAASAGAGRLSQAGCSVLRLAFQQLCRSFAESETSLDEHHLVEGQDSELGRPGMWLRMDLEKPPSTQTSCPVT